MKLFIYKGFDASFLKNIEYKRLVDKSINEVDNILLYDNEYKKEVLKALTMSNEDTWLTYNEFAFLCTDNFGEGLIYSLKTFNIDLHIILNNIYPEIYPYNGINASYLEKALQELEKGENYSVETAKILNVFNSITKINDRYYVRYKNIEYDFEPQICHIVNYYDQSPQTVNDNLETEFIFEISEDEELYIEKINELKSSEYKNIGIKIMGETTRAKKNYASLCAFLNKNSQYNISSYDQYGFRKDLKNEFKDIVTRVLKVPNFTEFRNIKFYSNPASNNEIIEINQTQIMSDMVNQAVNALECEELITESTGKKVKGYRDLFVTAPTGAGKSLMFQIPAIYLAEKYGALTIVITPLIELMNDQIKNLHERGYKAAERLNSSINQIKKEEIKKKIENGEINLLYLAPETLLSYSIDQLIGQRRIGLLIIDEAHIVSTWGKGFRPDYWYLGTYLGNLRKFRDYRGIKSNAKKIYCFPICTFTATAVNGGIYDDVSDIKNSLGLRDTITYFGNVIRDDISFDIKIKNDKNITNKDLYLQSKGKDLKTRIDYWLANNEKTIAYFPYASYAHHAYNLSAQYGFDALESIQKELAIYTAKETFEERTENINYFRSGEKKIMLATKAFGMGIDIKDIINVYHYAASGNLNDYIQEIGRCARSENINGKAITDYYKRDLNFMKTLYGMSSLHNYQVKKILSIIYSVYKSKQKYNLLVTPDMFKPVFPTAMDDSDLEVKIKTALLTIEKDLENRYKGSKAIVVRPRNMFTECFMMINKDLESIILKSEFGKFFKFLTHGRNKELTSDGAITTDMGDIYTLDLKRLWEEKFSNMTFGQFKSELFKNQSGIFRQFSHALSMRQRIDISCLGNYSLKEVRIKLYDEINLISDVLNKFQIEGSFFSTKDLASELKTIYKNKAKSDLVAGSYLELLKSYRDIKTANFCETKEINGETKYRITSGTYRSIAEKTISSSALIKKISKYDSDKCSFFEVLNKNKDDYNAINLAILFGLINFEVIGGNKPEIFIRINYPEKIRQIVEEKIVYNNVLINEAIERHKSDVLILNHFFTNLSSNEERWDFIENYYLGNIAIEEEKVMIKK